MKLRRFDNIATSINIQLEKSEWTQVNKKNWFVLKNLNFQISKKKKIHAHKALKISRTNYDGNFFDKINPI